MLCVSVCREEVSLCVLSFDDGIHIDVWCVCETHKHTQLQKHKNKK